MCCGSRINSTMNVGTAGKAILIVSTTLELLVGFILLWHRYRSIRFVRFGCLRVWSDLLLLLFDLFCSNAGKFLLLFCLL